MRSFEYIIVGSGPAGIAAARRLRGPGTCILDVGLEPEAEFPHPSLRDALAAGDVDALLGDELQTLVTLVEPRNAHTKLRSRGNRHVLSGESLHIVDESSNTLLRTAGSHAAGGMSTAWGGQLLRYLRADLEPLGDWPIDADDLHPHYEDLERHTGIGGAVDDMQPFLGGAASMMPPVPLVPAASALLARYARQARHRSGGRFLLGRSRVAVRTISSEGRPSHPLSETEFFSTAQHGFYSARQTLAQLADGGYVTYLPGYKVTGYREGSDYIEVDALRVGSGETCRFRARHLMLACGAAQTAKLVLQAEELDDHAVPFIDHLPILVPLFLPWQFGQPVPEQSYPVQLCGAISEAGRRDYFAVYYPGGMLWSDLLIDVPLPMSASVRLIGALISGMLVAQAWEPSRPDPRNHLRVTADGEIRITYGHRSPYGGMRSLLTCFRQAGALGSATIASPTLPGWGFHHAGCLPMRRSPGVLETHTDGRLWRRNRVRVIDGAALPSLPAKNHSLTMMANAARIADLVLTCGY
jgi:choline dehydrogenase-like flavoprotein